MWIFVCVFYLYVPLTFCANFILFNTSTLLWWILWFYSYHWLFDSNAIKPKHNYTEWRKILDRNVWLLFSTNAYNQQVEHNTTQIMMKNFAAYTQCVTYTGVCQIEQRPYGIYVKKGRRQLANNCLNFI